MIKVKVSVFGLMPGQTVPENSPHYSQFKLWAKNGDKMHGGLICEMVDEEIQEDIPAPPCEPECNIEIAEDSPMQGEIAKMSAFEIVDPEVGRPKRRGRPPKKEQ